MTFARNKYEQLQDEHEKLEGMAKDLDIQGHHVAQEALRLHKACPGAAVGEYITKYREFLELNSVYRKQVKTFQTRAQIVNNLSIQISEDLKPDPTQPVVKADRLKRTLLLKIAKDQIVWLENIKKLNENIDSEEKLALSKLV